MSGEGHDDPRGDSGKAPRARLSRTRLYRLTPYGCSLEFAYRSQLGMAKSSGGREGFERARERWGSAHGLKEDYGAYLVELEERDQTLPALEETLALCGQSLAMVQDAVRVLLSRAVITTEQPGLRGRHARMRATALMELADATRELEACRSRRAIRGAPQSDAARHDLTRALTRTIAARNYLRSFPG